MVRNRRPWHQQQCWSSAAHWVHRLGWKIDGQSKSLQKQKSPQDGAGVLFAQGFTLQIWFSEPCGHGKSLLG